MKLFKLSVSNKNRNFSDTAENNVYKIYFDNCVSQLDLSRLFSKKEIVASSRWSGQIVKDAVSLIGEVHSVRFPVDQGYRVFLLSWSSGDEPDNCYLVMR